MRLATPFLPAMPAVLVTSARCPLSWLLCTFRLDSNVGLVLVTLTLSEGGIVLVKLWLIFSWGSSSTGFTLSLLLPVPFT